MEIETAAVVTVAGKLDLLEKLLERRIMRAALDVTSPTLPLMEKVYKLGEYKRLTANLAVMEHRIKCALGDEEYETVKNAAYGKSGLEWSGKNVKRVLRKAMRILRELGVEQSDLEDYKRLPLYRAECLRIKRAVTQQKAEATDCCRAVPAAVYAPARDGRTAPVLL